MTAPIRHRASFRDPAGFLFWRDGRLFRQINHSYRQDYGRLRDSGLYEDLVRDGLSTPFREVDVPPADPAASFRVIEPDFYPFVSYPYEWCFSQLKDAALTTLAIQKRALRRGMTLRDASAYNIQFDMRGGRAVLIDTLSFEGYREGSPWTAYRQFCQHFLAPLALMAYCDIRLGGLLQMHVDGIPLGFASRLMPRRSHLNFGLLSHIHLHARAQRRYADTQQRQMDKARHSMSRNGMYGLVDNLESTVRKLNWQPRGTAWADYYDSNNYPDRAFERKRTLVASFLDRIAPASVWDLGANTGRFSRLASRRGIPTVAFDLDHGAVELNYRQMVAEGESHLLPLVVDLGNPSPPIGWDLKERQSIFDRGPADAVLALALVHHLAIGNNLPLEMIARSFASLGRWLVIEFVPKRDSQVQRMLAVRRDIFEHYHREGFETAFGSRYTVHVSKQIEGTERTLYLMERNEE